MPSPEFLGGGTTPRKTDTLWTIEQRILGKLNDGGIGTLSGSGAPDVSLGSDGDVYVDLDTGDLYIKTGGSWTLFSGAPGGSGLSGTVDPEGAVTASAGTTYANRTTHTLWLKETGAGNTGWAQYI